MCLLCGAVLRRGDGESGGVCRPALVARVSLVAAGHPLRLPVPVDRVTWMLQVHAGVSGCRSGRLHAGLGCWRTEVRKLRRTCTNFGT